ncbi:asparagine synthetase B family protein [Thalassospira lucentensis]|uniref:asparagine synthetase B family protein n=1 Tax=Thalassospira lucentensis TaxID=168935 RepID=UPI00142E3F30|nr:asparagine synthase-related protein [Thalassospira lucentensis]NIZ01955.1 asparagine synthetase B [Thalassospira lucentensis]
MKKKYLSGVLFTDKYNTNRFSGVVSDIPSVVNHQHPVFFRDTNLLLCFGNHETDQISICNGLVIAVDGIIYNRNELIERLNLRLSPNAPMNDAEIVHHAYRHWGNDFCKFLHGDWCAVLWDRNQQSLIISRDHFGNSTLYYYQTDTFLTFSTSREFLYQFGAPRPNIDEKTFAQHLISWPITTPSEFLYDRSASRLKPGYYLSAKPGYSSLHQYWSLKDTKLQTLKNRNEYADGFRDIFVKVVSERASTTDALGSMLSGGLDSGSVTAVSARFLRVQGKSIDAYTSVPLPDTQLFAAGRFGNELEFAQALVQGAGNISHHQITCSNYSPIQAIRDSLDIAGDPIHGSSNAFWILDLFRAAAANGNKLVLTGQMGNAGISWTGDEFSRPLANQISSLGLATWVNKRLKKALPSKIVSSIRHLYTKQDWSRSAISPALAERLNLHAERINDPALRYNRSAREARLAILKPTNPGLGAYYHALGRFLGITISDPTTDPRVLEFCLSVPDHIFFDPKSGYDRWLIREAMKGILPDPIRLNQLRGRQASDLLTRLRIYHEDVEAALVEIQDVAEPYLNLPRMRNVWERAKTENNQDIFNLATTVLMRGIMAGLYIKRLTQSGQ